MLKKYVLKIILTNGVILNLLCKFIVKNLSKNIKIEFKLTTLIIKAYALKDVSF